MKMSLQEFAGAQCQALIESGELSPGKLYSESAIAKQLGISRTPLRTALQQLERDGFIIRLPQRGFYVYQFGEKDIEEFFQIREAVEGFAVECLARQKPTVDLQPIRQHLAAQAQVIASDDFSIFIRADREFHENIVKALGNQRLMAIYSDLRQSIELIGLKRFKLNHQRNQSVAEHRAIVRAIERGDPMAARDAIYRHLQMAKNLLKAAFNGRDQRAEGRGQRTEDFKVKN